MTDTILDAGTTDATTTDAVATDVATTTDVAATTDTTDAVVVPPVAETDWRTEYAGGDDKLLKFTGKYTDLKALIADAKKSKDSLLQRSASKLPDNPSDEEVAAYRKEQGIPDKPEGYLETLPKGLVVGDDDRPAIDEFVKSMHAVNAPKGAVDAALSTYYKLVEEQQSAEVDRINTAKDEGDDTLHAEWGADYKRNINAVNALIETMPVAVASALTEGVDSTGLPLANNPAVVQWLAGLALEQNPLNTVVPGQGANQASAVADEIAKLETMMGDQQGAYWKGPEAAKHQARFLELVTASEKMKGR